MIYFVKFLSSLFFNVLSEFVLSWQICNTLSFVQNDGHVVGAFVKNQFPGRLF